MENENNSEHYSGADGSDHNGIYCGCGNPLEGSTGLCATCNRDLRKPPKNKKKKMARISQATKKRARELVKYSGDSKLFLKGNPYCGTGCGSRSAEVHHKAGRIGEMLLDQRYWLPVCRDCHTLIENNPNWAKENKYSLNRTEL